MAAAAPGAEFQFIAHLPEWGLDFPISDTSWDGALPAIKPEPGSTVWGAVYEIGKADLAQLNAIESEENRSSETVEAMDRTGKRHQVVVHLLDDSGPNNGNGSPRPSSEYLKLMVQGSRHWNLPVGWIAGLEEHLENGS
ncbi:MAG: gamma-glutamylcyclotransferase family protein [Acidimicrobiia bacterium]|nr:gamma-glutamylcyclotransferase family protein [Acidimicrobiia bacterium]